MADVCDYYYGFLCPGMMFFWFIGLLVVLVGIVQFLRLLTADADLTLAFQERFGIKVDVLKDNVVWITGASSGIGEYLAYEMAKVGAKIVISARREGELERVKKACLVAAAKADVKDVDVLIVPFDILKTETHEAALKQVVDHFKRVDIMVNNAGRSQRSEWSKIDLAVDRDIFELNVFSLVHLSRVVLQQMLKQGSGHLVSVSSAAGKLGVPLSASYSASKFALHGYFESLMVENPQLPIDVTMICPGPVESNIVQNAFTGSPGEVYSGELPSSKNMMRASRCAYLMTVAIANKLPEAWITIQPILLALYVRQYMPWTYFKLIKILSGHFVKNIRKSKY